MTTPAALHRERWQTPLRFEWQHLVRVVALLWMVGQGDSGLAAPTDERPTSVAARHAAWQRHVEMREASPFSSLAWRSLGPRKQGGRIECVACPPGPTRTIYVGAGSGNLWKTSNNGTTWQPIFEQESTFAMGDIAVSPSDPEVLWLGTGEVLMARSSYAGTGVFKSTDQGQSWRCMGLSDSHHIGKVLIHPSDPNTVYVAAIGHLYTENDQRGLFKTTDGGLTWQRILHVDSKTGVIDVVMDPSDSNRIYATSWQRSRKAWNHDDYGVGSGVHRSDDGGRSWARLTVGLPIGPAVGRVSIDIAASQPQILYALVDAREGQTGVYRSDDRGDSWRRVNRQPVRAGYDFCKVVISPDDEDEIYLPGFELFRSTDGGQTYQQILGTLVHMMDHDSKILHLDAHAFWIDPLDPDHLILGNDGGLHISYDRGASWLHHNTLPIGEFYSVWYDMAQPYNIYGGTQDNAALYGPSDQITGAGVADRWRHVYLDRWGGGDSYFTCLDPTDGVSIYYEHQFGDLRRKNMKTGQTKSIRPVTAKGQPRYRCNWQTPFVVSQYDPATIYYGAERMLKSVDRGDHWRAISGDLSTKPGPERRGNVPFGTMTTISESPLERGLLYVGFDDGNVQVTRDDGDSWALIRAGLPDKWVSRVVASRHAAATAYVTHTGYRDDDFSAYAYRSTDYGGSWEFIASGLPGESINVIHEDPKHAQILYVGTDLGVYVSLDLGRSWHSLCKTLPTTPVHDLFVHPRDAELVIGTHGRSVFVLDVRPIRDVVN